MKKYLFLLIVSTACTVLFADEKPLSNSDILSMTQAGVHPDAVLMAVKKKPGAYDTSPEALVALTKASVAKEVIAAIIEAGSRRAENEAPAQIVPNIAEIGAVVLIDGNKRTPLYSRGNAGRRVSFARALTGFGTTKSSVSGPKASARTNNPKVSLEIPLPPGIDPNDYVTLVAAEVKSDRREYTSSSRTIGVRNDPNARKFTLTELPTNPQSGVKRFSLVPDAGLTRGEYILLVGGPVYDFAVD